MKKHYLLALALLPLCASAQLKQIAFAELTAGSGMFFGAEMSTTTITVTLQGPSDRFLAFGFGTGMSTGNDALIWSTLGTGAAPLQVRDHRMIGQGNEPTVDAQQDWTVISNNIVGANRTIVASRALSTGDANDVTFNFASTTQNLFWAKAASASNQIAYHGGNRASGIVRNWVLVDQTAPLLNSTTPADNASSVSLTNNLIISFNEPIAWGTGSITLYDENNTVVQTISNGSSGVNIAGSNLSWNPTANLILNTDYYVHIDPTAIEDVAGNAFAGFTDNTTWNFNTNDVTAPVLTGTPFSPADNSAGVALNVDMTVTFNENIQFGTSGMIQLFDGSNNLIQSFDVSAPIGILISNAVLTINPLSDLVMNSDYYILIPAGAIEDLSGNDYAGISNQATWNFNTNDLVAPTAVTPFSPADNATNLPVATNLSISFNEDVELTASGELSLFMANGTLVAAYDMGTSGITVTGNQVDVILAPLDEQQGYYVTISPGFIADLGGNPFAGFTDQTSWNFTTGDFTAPAINGAFSPADNSIDVVNSIDLVATFTEPVVEGTGFIRLMNEDQGVEQTFNVATNPDVIFSGNTVTVQNVSLSTTLTPDDYHVTIDAGAVLDISGNAFAGISDTTDWNFLAQGEMGVDELTQAGIKWDGKVLTIGAKTAIVNLYDASGKLVKANLGQTTDCSALTPGIYLVGIRTESNYQTARIYVR